MLWRVLFNEERRSKSFLEKFATKLARKADFDQGAERVYFGLKFEKKFYQKWFAIFTAKAKINPFLIFIVIKFFTGVLFYVFPNFLAHRACKEQRVFLCKIHTVTKSSFRIVQTRILFTKC